MDPFQTYEHVKNLISSSGDSKFQFDYSSEKSGAIRLAFDSKENKPYAIGGEFSNDSYHGGTFEKVFSSKYEKEWLEFVQVQDNKSGENPKRRKITKTEGDEAEQVSSLQELSLKAIIREGKVPVDALLEMSSPAPFGKGNETVLDQEVRNAFEIKADLIPKKLFSHVCPGNSSEIRREIEEAMKCNKDSEWTYKLYKMHIYGPGGFFHSHVDTLHSANHIATVVVGLPTEFEGGDLIVKHHNNSSTFSLSNGTAQKTTYCAFFTDCSHEVKEVTSGYRIVLQYDVYENMDDESTGYEQDDVIENWSYLGTHSKPCDKMCYKKRDGTPDAAELAVLDYVSDLPENENVALLLQYRYSLPSLDAEILKGSDALVYDMFSSSGRWNCTLQGLILRAETDYEGKWEEGLGIEPVTMSDFGADSVNSEILDTASKTHLLLYSNSRKAPGQLLAEKRYIEYTGNEAEEGALAYFACCLILSPTSVGSAIASNKSS